MSFKYKRLQNAINSKYMSCYLLKLYCSCAQKTNRAKLLLLYLLFFHGIFEKIYALSRTDFVEIILLALYYVLQENIFLGEDKLNFFVVVKILIQN